MWVELLIGGKDTKTVSFWYKIGEGPCCTALEKDSVWTDPVTSPFGSAVEEKVKKRGQIGKISAREASPAVAWGGERIAEPVSRLPLGSLRLPISFSPTPRQCGAWSGARVLLSITFLAKLSINLLSFYFL